MTRDEVVAEARKWLGVRYRHKGRSERGLDCLGLLVMVGRAFDIPHTDATDYSGWPRGDLLILQTLDRFLVRQPPSAALPGCIGVFAERRLPGHVGVFSVRHGAIHVIHASLPPPSRVIEAPWQVISRRELHLIAHYALPGMSD
jgi:cell wall-associated NlpC family hydrolase